MKHILALLFIVVICPYSTHAQAWEWVGKAIGAGDAYSDAMTVDANGHSYVVGRFRDTLTIGAITLVSSGKWSLYIAKYESTGELLWAKITVIGATTPNLLARGISVDATGEIGIVGRFAGSAMFGHSNSVSQMIAGDEYDLFIVRLDPTGEIMWKQSLGTPGFDDAGGIGTDASGNSYVTGDFHISSFNGSAAKIFLAKYDRGGHRVWLDTAKDYGNGAYSLGIRTDPTGTSYIAGSFFNPLTFDSVHILDAGNIESNVYIAKFTNDGQSVWLQKGGNGGGYTIGTGIDVDDKGDCYLTGVYRGTASFGNLNITASPGMAYEVFIAKCNKDGEYQWVNRGIGEAHSAGIAADNLGNCYVAGSFSHPISFDSIALTNKGVANLFLAKADASGRFISAMQCTTQGNAYVSDVRTRDGDVLLAGGFQKEIDFASTIVLMGDSSRYQSFLAKLGSSLRVEEPERYSERLAVYPNPSFDGRIEISGATGLGAVSITDLLGRCIFETTTSSAAIETSMLPPGSYRVTTYKEGFTSSVAFVVLR